MIKRLLIAGLFLLMALEPGIAGMEDDDIVFHTGSSVTQDYNLGATYYHGHFGQYRMSGRSCCGLGASAEYRRYKGDPEGEIVARWKVYYLDPGKKDKSFEERILNKRFFYVHSRLPISMPPRHKDHWAYEIYIAFGPRNVMPQGLHPQDRKNARPVRNLSGVDEYVVGDIDTLHYFVRSRPKSAKPSTWPSVRTTPYPFTAVKGIEITQDQYMRIACEMVGSDRCAPYLEPDTPGLTPDQIKYVRLAKRTP